MTAITTSLDGTNLLFGAYIWTASADGSHHASLFGADETFIGQLSDSALPQIHWTPPLTVTDLTVESDSNFILVWVDYRAF